MACFRINLFTNPVVELYKLAKVNFNLLIGVFDLLSDNLLFGDSILTIILILKTLIVMAINNYGQS